jgi:hypothetical protein
MTEQERSKEQQAELARTLYPYARRLTMERHTDIRRKELLMEKGLTDSSALELIKKARRDRQAIHQSQWDDKNQDEAMRNMAIGGVICAIGLFVTFTSYQSAASSPTGGSYTLAWGAILFGGFQFLRGVYQMME